MSLARIVTHLLLLGTTRSGKTTYANVLHRTFAGVSVFVDTKGTDPLWGTRITDLGHVPALLRRGCTKFVWSPPRHATTGLDWPRAMGQLAAFWARIQGIATRTRAGAWPYLQVVVDEAQQWEGAYTTPEGVQKRLPAILEDMASRGLGLGLRLVYVTQYPAGLKPRTRTNLNARIVFAPGDEGARCIQQWGWDLGLVHEATSVPYGFASYVREWGWRHHAPLKTG